MEKGSWEQWSNVSPRQQNESDPESDRAQSGPLIEAERAKPTLYLIHGYDPMVWLEADYNVIHTQPGAESPAVRFGTPVVSTDEMRAAAEFWVTMTNGGSDVTLTGILMLQFADDGRCRELREAWHFEPGHHDPPVGWGL